MKWALFLFSGMMIEDICKFPLGFRGLLIMYIRIPPKVSKSLFDTINKVIYPSDCSSIHLRTLVGQPTGESGNLLARSIPPTLYTPYFPYVPKLFILFMVCYLISFVRHYKEVVPTLTYLIPFSYLL